MEVTNPTLRKTIAAMVKTPDEWLSEVSPQDKERGIFKLFLGYAPGVGKTYSMLSEAIRRASRGEDVQVGVVESHGRKATAELAAKLNRIPPRKLEYKGTVFDEMDVDAILARRPSVVLIDELAHTNIEGSKHAKRYEDVIELLDAKIDVLSTMNVQHVESLGPTVQQITGVQVRETVPDWVMQRVDEIVLADLTPQALQKRMERGDIYPVDRAQRALTHFFRPGNLIALRELALRQVTRVVDRSLDAYLEKDDTQQAHTVRERIAVCISSNPAAQYLIARGSRMAQAIGGELFVFYIDVGRDTRPEDQKTLAENIRFADNLGGKVVRATGRSVSDGVAQFVREHHITQVIFGRSARTGWQRYLYLSAIQRFLRESPSVDVHIVTQEAR
jgi:two-component system, OmpR family, sensor histidine kinase KdpD